MNFLARMLITLLFGTSVQAQLMPMAASRGLGQYGIQTIAVGGYHICALLDNGSVKCWGLNSSGQLGLEDTNSRGDAANEMSDFLPVVKLGTNRTARNIVAGGYHTCALLDNGSVKCWGQNDFGQLGLGDINNRGDAAGEMGDNLTAVDLGTNRTAKSLSAGIYHTCAILDNNSVKCWGRNGFGQLGLGSMTHRGDGANEMGDNLLAVDLGTNRTARSIVTGVFHTCALLDNYTVKCWGYNNNGQLGQGDTTTRGDGANEMGDNLTAIDFGTNRTVRSITAGQYHNCVILDNVTTKCWGYNAAGELGLEDTNNRGDAANEMGDNLTAVSLGTNRTARSITTGGFHNCAILDNGTTKCWGRNGSGQLGTGDVASRGDGANEMGDNLATLSLGTNRTARALSSGGASDTCALLDNGTLKCWGQNTDGQLGLGDTLARGDGANEMGDSLAIIRLGRSKNKIATNSLKPIGDNSPELFEQTGETNSTTLVAGANHTCAILDNGMVKCWGANDVGQLGQGDINNRADAVSEMGDSLPTVDLGTNRKARSLAAGSDHTCAILDNGTVKCWGSNVYGQLGLGDTVNRGDAGNQMGDNLSVVDLGTNRTARKIVAGNRHNCAILDNGTVKCWGGNSSGHLGQGNTAALGDGPGEMGDNLPTVNLGTNRTAQTLAAGYNFTCAILDNGTTKCWGGNAYGQLGQGNTTVLGDNANEMGDNLPTVNLGTNLTARQLYLSAQSHVACASLNTGALKCWGRNDTAQLGLGDLVNRGDAGSQMGDSLPVVDLGTGRTVRNLSCGASHTCAVLDNGTVKCWGKGASGRLGSGDAVDRGDGANEMGDNLAVVSLGTNLTARNLVVGNGHSCVVLNTGSVKCWGLNGQAQLGIGDVTPRGGTTNQMGDFLRIVRLGQ